MIIKLIKICIVFSVACLCVSCSGPPGTDANGKITRVENEIPRLSDPNPFKVLLSSFNNLLNLEFNRSRPKTSLDSLMNEYKIPGVCIAVIDNYEIDWMKAYGKIHAGRDIKVTPETYFEAASTTKHLTAALVMKLVEQGKLDLDKDVNGYLKSWKIPDSPLLNNKKITLRMLLSHVSGMSEGGGFGTKEGEIPSIVDVLEGRNPATNEAAKIDYEPGTQWRYSNFGFVVIQLVLEDHLGRSYAELMQEYIFDPLDMKRSTFAHHDKKAIRDEAIVPHDQDGTPYERNMNATIKAHGDLQISPADLARFTIALMKAYTGKPNALFSRETARAMLDVSWEIKPEEYYGLTGMSYGFGAFLLGADDAFYFMHPGSNNPGASCMLIANPAAGKGAVVMTNGAQGMLLGNQLVSAVAMVYDWPYNTVAQPETE